MVGAGYPPDVHVLRDLALEVQHSSDESRAWLAVSDHVCNEAGRVRSGVLTVLVDAISGGLAASTAAPDWIATADLTLHVTRPVEASGLRNGELEAVARVARAGRTTVVLEAAVLAGAEAVAVATLTFGVLARREGNPVMPARAGAGTRAEGNAASRTREPFLGAAGGFTRDAYDTIGFVDHGGGTVELIPSDYVVNSIGGVQGGVLGALVDASVCSALGPGHELADLHLVYLALARRGPIRATAERLTTARDHGTVAVAVHDLGAGRRTTVATASGVRW